MDSRFRGNDGGEKEARASRLGFQRSEECPEDGLGRKGGGNRVYELLGEPNPLVRGGPQVRMRVAPVEQANQDAFGFGDFNGGYEVAVPRDDGGFLDDMLRRQHRQVDAKQTVDLLLFECVTTLGVGTASGEPAHPNRESRQALQRLEEIPPSGIQRALLIR